MEQRLLTLATLGAAGRFAEIRGVVRDAESAGVAPDAILETLAFLVPYAGWPTALNAILAAELPPRRTASMFDEADREERRKLGWRTARQVNAHFDRVAEKLAAIDPALVDHLVESAYGYAYLRPGLDLAQRELLAVAILSVQRHERQLLYHLRGALNVGATAGDIEVVVDVLRGIDPEAYRLLERCWRELYKRLNP